MSVNSSKASVLGHSIVIESDVAMAYSDVQFSLNFKFFCLKKN